MKDNFEKMAEIIFEMVKREMASDEKIKQLEEKIKKLEDELENKLSEQHSEDHLSMRIIGGCKTPIQIKDFNEQEQERLERFYQTHKIITKGDTK